MRDLNIVNTFEYPLYGIMVGGTRYIEMGDHEFCYRLLSDRKLHILNMIIPDDFVIVSDKGNIIRSRSKIHGKSTHFTIINMNPVALDYDKIGGNFITDNSHFVIPALFAGCQNIRIDLKRNVVEDITVNVFYNNGIEKSFSYNEMRKYGLPDYAKSWC